MVAAHPLASAAPALTARPRRRSVVGFDAVRPIHYVMIAPVHLLLLGLLVLPALYVAWLSFNTSSYGQAATFVGWANYIQILHDPVFWRAARNTVVVVNLVVWSELLLGLGLALLLVDPLPFKKLVIAVIMAPYAVTEVSTVVMWRYLLEPDVGLATQGLAALGLGQIDWSTNPAETLLVAALMAVWHHVPFTFLILYAALMSVPRELLEAAEIDGANALQRLWHVRLRLIMPALLIAVLFRYIFAMRLFSEIWLLTEGGPARLTEVLAIYLYRDAFRYHAFGPAAATGWALLLLSLVIALPYLWVMWRGMARRG